MKAIRRYFEKKREKWRAEGESSLRSEFKVVERGGFLWLTHNGVAFTKINDGLLAEDVSALLKEARDAAVEFEKL